MTDTLTPSAPQRPMIEWVMNHERCNLWASMGIGKTSGVLLAFDTMRLLGVIGNAPLLVLAPKRVARDTWPTEVGKWANFHHLRIEALTRAPAKLTADIYTINYERLPELVQHYMGRWPFRYVVADESDRLKGFRLRQGGMRAQWIARVAHTLVDRWINLTGTPSANGLQDLWGQQWYIDRGQRLGQTHEAFKTRWFQRKWSGYGMEPLPHAEEQIKAALRDVTLTIDAKDYFKLDEPIVTSVRVQLPKAARALYKKLEKEMFLELLTGDVTAMNAAALTNKCLQLANGAVYTTRPAWESVHDEKLQALASIQAESGGMPLLVAYQFRSDAARILKAFPNAVDISTPGGLKQFMTGRVPMGIAHPKSMGHGIDGLQKVTNILVRFGHDWNLGDYLQMRERIGPMRQRQAGLERPVYEYDIVADGTLDDTVIDARRSKIRVQDALLEAMKRGHK